MRHRIRVVTASLIAALALAACSSSSSKTSTNTVATTTSTSGRAAPASFSELAARIVTAVPTGFELQPDDVGDTGPSDLAKAIKDDGSPDAGTTLRSEGFVRGYQHLWVGPGDAEIIVFLYQFKSATGARQDFARAADAYAGDPPPGVPAKKFAVQGLPASESLGIAGADKSYAAAIIFFTTGVFNVQITSNGKAATKVPLLQARATSIALDQFDRLNR